MGDDRERGVSWSAALLCGFVGALIGGVLSLAGAWLFADRTIDAEFARVDRLVAEAAAVRSEERRVDAYARYLAALDQWVGAIDGVELSSGPVPPESVVGQQARRSLDRIGDSGDAAGVALGFVGLVGRQGIVDRAQECHGALSDVSLDMVKWIYIVMLSSTDEDQVFLESADSADQTVSFEGCRAQLKQEMQADLEG